MYCVSGGFIELVFGMGQDIPDRMKFLQLRDEIFRDAQVNSILARHQSYTEPSQLHHGARNVPGNC